MLVAALDLATRSRHAALVELQPDGRLVTLASRELPARDDADPVPLPGLLFDLLDETGGSIATIDVYAVGTGPGSTADSVIADAVHALQELSEAHQRPLIGVSSLLALARGFSATMRADSAGDWVLVPLLRRGRGTIAGFFKLRPDGTLEGVQPDLLLRDRDPGLNGIPGLPGTRIVLGGEVALDIPSKHRVAHEPRTPRAWDVAAVALGAMPAV
jgi:hypothetical protein